VREGPGARSEAQGAGGKRAGQDRPVEPSRRARPANRGGPGHNGDMPDDSPTLEVDLESFAEAHAAGATVLDVRNPDEYETAHVAGAFLIPLPELAARQDEIPEGDPLYVICAVGGRSLTATRALVGAGYRAVSVAGGTNGWIERGWPVVTGPEAS
jgi:rhodanese-related sulfurtransferase